MKIIFDLRAVGLGNNGGSSTLVKSGNTLVDLGHEVTFVDHMRNMHTWTPLEAKHKIVKRDLSRLPSADIIIATGYKSVAHTIRAPKRCGISQFQSTHTGTDITNIAIRTIEKKNPICCISLQTP